MLRFLQGWNGRAGSRAPRTTARFFRFENHEITITPGKSVEVLKGDAERYHVAFSLFKGTRWHTLQPKDQIQGCCVYPFGGRALTGGFLVDDSLDTLQFDYTDIGNVIASPWHAYTDYSQEVKLFITEVCYAPDR
ncbi:MAG: hypothetical protein MJA83_12255 [Gammaproteobacteria bacterium]|nr:hypothetical protein [Gammaproteobacteria bacterium]